MTFFLSCVFFISDLDSNHVQSFSFRFLIMCLRFYFYFFGFGWFVAGDWWNAEYFQTIPDNQLGQMNWVTTNFMQYNYCTDTLRYPIAPFECTAPYNSWIKICRSANWTSTPWAPSSFLQPILQNTFIWISKMKWVAELLVSTQRFSVHDSNFYEIPDLNSILQIRTSTDHLLDIWFLNEIRYQFMPGDFFTFLSDWA